MNKLTNKVGKLFVPLVPGGARSYGMLPVICLAIWMIGLLFNYSAITFLGISSVNYLVLLAPLIAFLSTMINPGWILRNAVTLAAISLCLCIFQFIVFTYIDYIGNSIITLIVGNLQANTWLSLFIILAVLNLIRGSAFGKNMNFYDWKFLVVVALGMFFLSVKALGVFFLTVLIVVLLCFFSNHRNWKPLLAISVLTLVISFGLSVTGADKFLGERGYGHEKMMSDITDFVSDSEGELGKDEIAIINGKIMGVGPFVEDGVSSDYRAYITDPYAVLMEQYGIITAILIILLYLWFLYTCIKDMRSMDQFSSSIIMLGLCLFIVIPAFMDIGGTLGLFPIQMGLPGISVSIGDYLIYPFVVGVMMRIKKDHLTGRSNLMNRPRAVKDQPSASSHPKSDKRESRV